MPALTKIPLSCPAAPPPFFIPLTPTLSRREREKYPPPVLPLPTVLPTTPFCHARSLKRESIVFSSPLTTPNAAGTCNQTMTPCSLPVPPNARPHENPTVLPAAPPPFSIPLTPTLSRREREKEKYPPPVLPILTVLPLPPVLRLLLSEACPGLLLSGDCSPSPTVLPAPPSCHSRNPPPVIPTVLSGNPSSFLSPSQRRTWPLLEPNNDAMFSARSPECPPSRKSHRHAHSPATLFHPPHPHPLPKGEGERSAARHTHPHCPPTVFIGGRT